MSSSAFGLLPVPRSLSTVLASIPHHSPQLHRISSIPLPSSPLAEAIRANAASSLSPETYNHSVRVFTLGILILRDHFHLSWSESIDNETYFIACMLHDIGSTEKNIVATKLSFEYYGGLVARDLVRKEGGDEAQADSVCETIIRHQDIGERGKVSALTQLVQMATILDNVGLPQLQSLVHPQTLEELYKTYPRGQWSSCFAEVIRQECELKPYSSTTRLGEQEDICSRVLKNPLNRYEA